jgi:hypothetical protein
MRESRGAAVGSKVAVVSGAVTGVSLEGGTAVGHDGVRQGRRQVRYR